ncbi:MAG: GNAT superfamily N-acetyltransferase [Planctomycetota bacterium]|jgi:GNAT superfamily N-acetyltransferase
MEDMNQPSYRSATLDDLPILLEFEQGIVAAERPFDPTLKPDPISYYDLEVLIRSEDAQVVVAVVNDELVGSGYLKIMQSKPYLTHEFHGYIGFMFVRPEHRGKGIGQGLIEKLIGWARVRGLKEVRLDVYDENEVAVRSYKKAGFSKNLVEMRLAL